MDHHAKAEALLASAVRLASQNLLNETDAEASERQLSEALVHALLAIEEQLQPSLDATRFQTLTEHERTEAEWVRAAARSLNYAASFTPSSLSGEEIDILIRTRGHLNGLASALEERP